MLRSKVGLVFQYPEHQLFETDVFSDVCFGPKNLGLSQKEVQLRAYEALKLVGLEDEYFISHLLICLEGRREELPLQAFWQ